MESDAITVGHIEVLVPWGHKEVLVKSLEAVIQIYLYSINNKNNNKLKKKWVPD